MKYNLFAARGPHGSVAPIADWIDATGDCWEYKGVPNSRGYCNIKVKGHTIGAHIVVYEALVGNVPEGLELDHLCRNTICVNPDHLEPVTHRENLLRSPTFVGKVTGARTHCSRGHRFTEENTRERTDGGGRACRTCQRENQRNHRAKKEPTDGEG